MTDPQFAKLTMRCSRRGIKEMDVILGGFAKTELGKLSPDELKTLENMLEENDHDILSWILGRSQTPSHYASLVQTVKTHHDL